MNDGSEDIGGGRSTPLPPGALEHQQFPYTASSGHAAFDASQYEKTDEEDGNVPPRLGEMEFFGNEVLQEVKLGEMDEEEGDVPPGLGEMEFSGNEVLQEVKLREMDEEEGDVPPGLGEMEFSGNEVLQEVKLGEMDEEEGDVPPGLEAGLDDEEFLYDKLNKTVSGQGVIGEWLLSREGSSATELTQGDEPYWYEQIELDFDSNLEGKQWSSQPYSSPNNMPEDSKPIFRTSSYPELQQPPKKMSVTESLLPEEIIFNILSRLPVRSICRFKSVSKSWLSILTSRAFVACHSARSESRPGVLVTICLYKDPNDGPGGECRHLFTADHSTVQEKGSFLFLRQRVTMAVKHKFNGPIPHVISPGDSQSVSGLMFGLCPQEMIKIANPITNQCFAFPRAFPRNYSPSLLHVKTNRYVFLGFDPIEGKHKILESLSVFDGQHMVMRAKHRVVTVGDYENWRSVEGPYIDRGKHYGQEICVKGVIYFIAQVSWPSGGGIEEKQLSMVAFSVKTESFQAVKLSFREKRSCCFYYPWMYAELEGKVAVIDYPFSNREGCDVEEHALELWVLEDFQTQYWRLDWSVKLSALPMKMDNPYSPKHKLVGTTRDGKLIFVVFEGGDDFCYCSYNAMLQDVTQKGLPFSFLFLDTKTGDFWRSAVRLPDGFAVTGQVRITAMGHVESCCCL